MDRTSPLIASFDMVSAPSSAASSATVSFMSRRKKYADSASAAIERFGRKATCRTYTASATAMQEAEAVALHSSLSAAAPQRGAGGLGIEGGKSKKEKKTKAEKELMTSKHSTGREFATTTASAVAAGHWDPWARPVEFKMKEVNRRVGGLYTMLSLIHI